MNIQKNYLYIVSLAICLFVKNVINPYMPVTKLKKLDIVIKAMKSTLNTTIISLKSKIPFLDNIVENAKSEENKYWKDIRQMQAEVQSVASSLKELICKSVDMVMFENLDILESFSRVDKKIIETYVEEVELNRLSIIRLITAIEATIKYGHSKENS